MPWTVFGDLTITVEQNVPGLGPVLKTTRIQRWGLERHILPLAPWILFLSLFLVPRYRRQGAWAALIPVLGLAGLSWVLQEAFATGLDPASYTDNYPLLPFLRAAALGLGTLWVCLPLLDLPFRRDPRWQILFPLGIGAGLVALAFASRAIKDLEAAYGLASLLDFCAAALVPLWLLFYLIRRRDLLIVLLMALPLAGLVSCLSLACFRRLDLPFDGDTSFRLCVTLALGLLSYALAWRISQGRRRPWLCHIGTLALFCSATGLLVGPPIPLGFISSPVYGAGISLLFLPFACLSHWSQFYRQRTACLLRPEVA